jgi:PAS domain S-box-containing protein
MARSLNRSLPLILAREFAANVATPFLVLDRDGTLVYFNERAEQIIGQSAAELGELEEHEWRARFSVERPDGSPVESADTPSAVARRECRPVHDVLVYTNRDGSRRTLSVTATPLLGRDDTFEGVFLLFWEIG